MRTAVHALHRLGLLWLLGTVGCASDGEPPAAAPVGDLGQDCYGNDTCNGALTCEKGVCVEALGGPDGTGGRDGGGANPAGSGGDAPDGSGGTAGRGGTGTGGTEPRPPGLVVGAPCQSDTDCPGEGLFCVTSEDATFFGGGPQGGLCVADCTDGGQDACAAVDDNAVCVEIEGEGTALCLEACFTGPPAPGEVKCGLRADMFCTDPTNEGLGFCRPACAGDFACGSRICDLGLGVCIDPSNRVDGLPIGAECDPSAASDPCATVCLPFQDGVGICSGLCTIGTAGCGSNLQSPDPFDALCLYSPPAADIGDEGACGQLCDCNDDCLHPEFVCIADAELADITLRAGFCAIADASSGIACARQADAAPSMEVDTGAGGSESDAATAPEAAAPAADSAP